MAQGEVIGPAGAALLYVLLGWALAAAILSGVYSINSLEASLVRVSVLASAPAMWLAPAVLLIGTPAPLQIAIGLALIAIVVMDLVSRGLSRRTDLPLTQEPAHRSIYSRTSPAPKIKILSYRDASPSFRKEIAAVILGALFLQLGIVAIVAGYGLLSAVMIGAGTMIWTLSAIAIGVHQPRKRIDSPRGALITFLVTMAISVILLLSDNRTVAYPTTPQVAYRTLEQFIHAGPAAREAPRKTFTRLFTGEKAIPPATRMIVDGVEGVILRPGIVRPGFRAGFPRKTPHASPASQMKFRFTGEYRLFPASSRGVKNQWQVQNGTPIDSLYATVSGGPLQTEADQTLDPPVDFGACQKLAVALVSHEDGPAAATVQLTGDRKVQDLGPEIFGLDRSAEETIEFEVPDSLHGLQVSGIRFVFTCIAGQCSQSIRVAVQGFHLSSCGGRPRLAVE